jgi:hypothetical protein
MLRIETPLAQGLSEEWANVFIDEQADARHRHSGTDLEASSLLLARSMSISSRWS